MALQPVQIQFHLPFVARLEIMELEINRHQPPQLSMIEQQVEMVVAVVNLHPLLARHETKPDAQLQNERLHLAQKFVVERDNLAKVSPSQLCPQCGHNLDVRENLGETDHAEEISHTKAATELFAQFCPQRGHNLFAIVRALILENVLMNPATDVAVKRDQPGIHRPRHLLPRRKNEFANVRQQRRDAARGLGGNFGEREFLRHKRR